MKIMNNSAAMMALGELKKNDKSLSKQQKKVGTGMKIVGAGDGASEYAISERMRTNIRALNQANDNVTTGKNMINLASAAIDQQVSLMRQVAARTMQASDDTYNDNDRATLNKEISQLLDQSDDIARQTTYNGIHLLDQARVSKVTPWFDADAPFHANKNPIVSLSVLQSTGEYLTNPTGGYVTIQTNTSGQPTNLYSASKGSALTANPKNGSVVWDDVSGQPATAVYSYGSNTTINLSTGRTVNGIAGLSSINTTQLNTIPAAGTAVVVPGSNGSWELGTITTHPGSGQTVVCLNSTNPFGNGISDTTIDFSSLFSTATNIPSDFNGVGFSFTCNACPQYVSIQFDASTSDSHLYVGETSKSNPKPMCYVIGVAGVTTQQDFENAVFNGLSSAGSENPRYSGTVIPSTLDRTKDSTVAIASAHSIKLQYYASTGKFIIDKDGPSMTYKNGVIGEMKATYGYRPEQLKYLQSSNKGSQNTAINLPNTTLSILFPRSSSHWDIDPTSEDYPTTYSADYSNCKNETERRLQWKDTEWPYPSKYVAFDKDHMVDTREKASAFLDNVHQAIKYLLYSNTTLGAQSNRLNYTSANLVNTVENTQASESTIRDADMAKEMTSYVKSNVLAQSAQAMLAQANQNSSSVLSLLQ